MNIVKVYFGTFLFLMKYCFLYILYKQNFSKHLTGKMHIIFLVFGSSPTRTKHEHLMNKSNFTFTNSMICTYKNLLAGLDLIPFFFVISNFSTKFKIKVLHLGEKCTINWWHFNMGFVDFIATV